MGRLEFEVPALRACGERHRDLVRVQVLHELDRPREGAHGRPTLVLHGAPYLEVIVDREERRKVWEEGEQVCCGFAFRCGGCPAASVRASYA